jgi:FkbM family methyltransferase
MRSKNSIDLFTGAYSLARRAKLLQIPLFRRLFVASYFQYKRFYEDPFWMLVQGRPELFAGGDVLDVGANIGYTACLFARAVKPGSKVFAFEPDEPTCKLLSEVIRRKKLANTVEPLNMAVGDSEGYLEFWHNEEHSADHRVATHEFRNVRPDATQLSRVLVTTLDAFVKSRNLRKISFIKIDVQGYELAVCEGMKRTLEAFPDACVCFEYMPEALRELGFEPTKLLDFFRARGYQLHVLTRAELRAVNDNEELEPFLSGAGYVDLLCSKKLLA